MTQQTNMTAEQLRAELAALESQQQAEQQRRADALQKAQEDHARYVLATWQALDAEQTAEGHAHEESARQALLDLDLNGAFAGFTRWKATRITRNHLRTAARTAHAQLGTTPGDITDLRDVLETFSEWLARETFGTSRPEVFIAQERAEELLGTPPTTYEDLEG